MKQTEAIRKELAAELDHIKWILSGLRMKGILDWPSPHPLPDADMPVGEESVSPSKSPEQALQEIRDELGDCKRCRLHEGRRHLVFGEGSARPVLVFVGEGPGFDEDRQGRPFVGRAGKLLDKMIRSLGLEREQVYICNVVKCRPPNNRTPNPDEIDACSPFLTRQLTTLRPKVICALGACAAQTLLGTSSAISKLRGKVHSWRGIPLVSTFHPAYLLRNPAQKGATWQDLLIVHQILHANEKDH